MNFLRALHRAIAFIHSHAEEAAAIVAEATGLEPQVAARAMERHDYRLVLDDAIIDSLQKTASFLKAQGTIAELPDLDKAADGRFLQRALSAVEDSEQ